MGIFSRWFRSHNTVANQLHEAERLVQAGICSAAAAKLGRPLRSDERQAVAAIESLVELDALLALCEDEATDPEALDEEFDMLVSNVRKVHRDRSG